MKTQTIAAPAAGKEALNNGYSQEGDTPKARRSKRFGIKPTHNDGLAELIIRAWNNGSFDWPDVPARPAIGFPGWAAGSVTNLKNALLERNPAGSKIPSDKAVMVATNAVNIMAKMDLQRAVIISEAEHDDDYTQQAENEVVFVLPDDKRALFPSPIPTPTPKDLLETARCLMACTPNGI